MSTCTPLFSQFFFIPTFPLYPSLLSTKASSTLPRSDPRAVVRPEHHHQFLEGYEKLCGAPQSFLKSLFGSFAVPRKLCGASSLFGSLNFLKSFNVSYNSLEGSIPRGTQLQSFNASAFEGNEKLCGAPLPNECLHKDTNVNNSKDGDNGNRIPWFELSVVLGFIVGFLGVCGPLLLKKTWRYAYFQFVDNLQHKLRRVRLNRQQQDQVGQVPKRRSKDKNSHLRRDTFSTNCSTYATESQCNQNTSVCNGPIEKEDIDIG